MGKITIPPEVVAAYKRHLEENVETTYEAAISAGLLAWPGMTHGWIGDPHHYKGGENRIILPLPKETSDE